MPIDTTDIAIVLTGTIIPNAPFTVHSDPVVRRREYLQAIDFYSSFARVYFLENSTYDLESDSDFHARPRVNIRRFRPSMHTQKGKGFQEFEMLDSWLLAESEPPQRWIKVTGRYIFSNFDSLLEDCRKNTSADLIIDLCGFSHKARTHLFCARTDFYLKFLVGSYLECNDETGEWIEKVLYGKLRRNGGLRTAVFSVEPDLRAISGSTGGNLESPPAKLKAKSFLRSINRLIDETQLWYTR